MFKHDREKVKLAYDLREENPGMTAGVIGRKIGVGGDTVRRWFNRPETFDPYSDEVAVRRAFQGDMKVYDNLTVFELDEVHAKLSAERQAYQGSYGTSGLGVLWTRFEDAAHRIQENVKLWEEAEARRKERVDLPRKPYVPRDRVRVRTPEMVAKVKALHEEGVIFRDIAQQLGISYDTARRAGNAA